MTTKPTPVAAYEAAAREALEHNYYDEAMATLSDDVAKFVESTSWAGELHLEGEKLLQLKALTAAAQQYARAVGKEAIGERDPSEFPVKVNNLPGIATYPAGKVRNELRAAQLARLERVVGERS